MKILGPSPRPSKSEFPECAFYMSFPRDLDPPEIGKTAVLQATRPTCLDGCDDRSMGKMQMTGRRCSGRRQMEAGAGAFPPPCPCCPSRESVVRLGLS